MHFARMDLHDRLRFARLKAGYKSAADAARRLGVPYGTYSGHENGSRGIKGSDIIKYARAFGVPAAWLTIGDIDSNNDYILECIGTAGGLSNGQISINKNEENRFDVFLSPLIDQNSAYIIVTGNDLRGIAEEGYIIICSSDFEKPNRKHVDNLCICELEDGRFYIRNIAYSSDDGRFDLEAPLFSSMRGCNVSSVSLVYLIATKYMVNLMAKSSKSLEGYLEKYIDLPEPTFVDDYEAAPRKNPKEPTQ